ncbi:MAG TPA: class I SAM-dependent methyltransferase, partial [Cyclobacteriaceae bacterium]
MQSVSETYVSVNRAFSKQSTNYDVDDAQNKVLQDLRLQVYDHVNRWIKPNSTILELNAGTGIDAYHFVQQGHTVHATDLSDGMIAQINAKIQKYNLHNQLSCQQVSYDNLDKVTDKKFDYVFSNFGGLNCIQNLSEVTKNLPSLLNNGAYVTFVIMPPVCLWELLWFFKGHGKAAFRRFHKDGVMAHLEGEYFRTYYHSLRQIKEAFGSN